MLEELVSMKRVKGGCGQSSHDGCGSKEDEGEDKRFGKKEAGGEPLGLLSLEMEDGSTDEQGRGKRVYESLRQED